MKSSGNNDKLSIKNVLYCYRAVSEQRTLFPPRILQSQGLLSGSGRSLKATSKLPHVRPFLDDTPTKISHHFVKFFLTKTNVLSLEDQTEAIFLSLEGKIHVSIIKNFFLNSPIDLGPRKRYWALREEIHLHT